MNANEALKTKYAESVFSALAIFVLLILSLWGAVAMLAGSVIGLAAYSFLFREQLRGRGWLTAAISAVVAAALAAAVAITVSLIPPR